MSKIVYYNKNGGKRKYLYDELEYLYNDSKAYFLTDYYGKSNSRYELKIEPTNNNTTFQVFMTVGRPSSTHTIGMGLFFRPNGDFGYNWNGVTNDNAFNVGFGNPNIISYDVSDLYVNDVHRTNTASWNGNDTSPLEIMVLGNGNYDQYAYGKLYYFKVYEDDELVRDYIPIRSGNTIGLYDKVLKTITIPSYGSFKASENYIPVYSEEEKTIEVLDLYNDYEVKKRPVAQWVNFTFDTDRTIPITKVKLKITQGGGSNCFAQLSPKPNDTGQGGVRYSDGYVCMAVDESQQYCGFGGKLNKIPSIGTPVGDNTYVIQLPNTVYFNGAEVNTLLNSMWYYVEGEGGTEIVPKKINKAYRGSNLLIGDEGSQSKTLHFNFLGANVGGSGLEYYDNLGETLFMTVNTDKTNSWSNWTTSTPSPTSFVCPVEGETIDIYDEATALGRTELKIRGFNGSGKSVEFIIKTKGKYHFYLWSPKNPTATKTIYLNGESVYNYCDLHFDGNGFGWLDLDLNVEDALFFTYESGQSSIFILYIVIETS